MGGGISNYDAPSLDFGSAPSVLLNCGVSTFDSSSSVFTNFCGATPTPVSVTQSDGSTAVVLRVLVDRTEIEDTRIDRVEKTIGRFTGVVRFIRFCNRPIWINTSGHGVFLVGQFESG